MRQLSASELAQVEALSSSVPESVLSLPSTRAAIRRCRAAWLRTYKECMKNSKHDADLAFLDKSAATESAAKAFCNAMPLLAGYEGVRDFVACTAYGILIGAIPAKRSGQLLYAAQVALGVLPRAPKPPQKA